MRRLRRKFTRGSLSDWSEISVFSFLDFSISWRLVSSFKYISSSPTQFSSFFKTHVDCKIHNFVLYFVLSNFCNYASTSTTREAFCFSITDIHLHTLELEGLTIEEAKGDEITNRKAPKGELESETPISEVSTSNSQSEIEGKSDSQWRGFLRKLKKGPVGFNPFHPSMPSFPSLPSIKKISRKKSRNITQSLPSLPPNLDSQFCHCFEASWKNFTLPELQTATDNFSHGIQLSKFLLFMLSGEMWSIAW